MGEAAQLSHHTERGEVGVAHSGDLEDVIGADVGAVTFAFAAGQVNRRGRSDRARPGTARPDASGRLVPP